MSQQIEDLLRVGVITSTHGIKGEVKVFPTTDDVNRFQNLKSVLLEDKKQLLELHITSARFFKKYVIIKFKEYNDINQVEALKGNDLFVTRENAVDLEEGEYFICDLIGLDVVTEDGADLGVLKDILKTGANDVYVVETGDRKEVLLPSIPECILDIDIEKRKILVHIMPGLL